jgi:hypothetical protein
MDYKRHPERHWRHILSIPFIWGMLIPIIFLDVTIEIYHQICFRLYGIPRVKRSNYILFDRSELKYITNVDKANCMYCSYANGLFRYAGEIAGRTEQYWCGIKHNGGPEFVAPEHQKVFVKYGDEKSFKKRYL